MAEPNEKTREIVKRQLADAMADNSSLQYALDRSQVELKSSQDELKRLTELLDQREKQVEEILMDKRRAYWRSLGI